MRDILLTGFIFALLPVCLVRPWIGVLVWTWFGLMNPHRLTWGFAYSIPFGMLIAGATLAGLLFAKDRRPVPWNGVLVLIAILFAYFTLTTFFAWAPANAWNQWNKIWKILLMTFVATTLIYGRERIRYLMLTIVVSIGFYGVKGGIWSITTGGAHKVLGPEGTFIDDNTFIGLAFNMVVPLMVILAREEKGVWTKPLLYIAAGLTMISTIFTYSRGAYVGLAILLPLLFLESRKKVIAGAILIPALVLGPMVLPEAVFKRADETINYEEDMSANQRLFSWSVAFNVARDFPLTGAGFEFEYDEDVGRWLDYGDQSYRRFTDRQHSAHSIFFQILGQHGFLAFFLYVALLVSVMVSLQRTKKRALQIPDRAWVGTYASALQVALIAYLVTGAFLSSAYFDLAWLYYAMSAILARELKTSELVAEPQPAGAASARPTSREAAGAALRSASERRS